MYLIERRKRHTLVKDTVPGSAFVTRLLAVLAAALLTLCAGNAIAQAAYVHNLNGAATASLGAAARPLKIGDILASGTTITTGARSAAILKFEDGQVIALGENSSFRIVDYRFNKQRVADSSAVFSLLRGGLRFISGMIGATNRNNFRLTAGAATIGIRGTSAAIVFDERAKRVVAAVMAGALEMATADGAVVVGAGNVSTYDPAQAPALTAPAPIQNATDAVKQSLAPLLASISLNNRPVVIQASADAAAAAAQARILAAQAAANPADQALQRAAQDAAKLAEEAVLRAIQAAQQAYQEGLKGGGVELDPEELPPPADAATQYQIQQLITPGGTPCSVASCN
jgi:hypothetical protein